MNDGDDDRVDLEVLEKATYVGEEGRYGEERPRNEDEILRRVDGDLLFEEGGMDYDHEGPIGRSENLSE